MWILMIAFASANFSVVVDNEDGCMDFMRANAAYWSGTDQHPTAVCMHTLRT